MKFPVLSYTLLNTWEICPHQTYRKYIAKDLPREKKTPEQQKGIDDHVAVEKRVRNKIPLPESIAHYETLVASLDGLRVEPELEVGITEAGRPCGFWDDEVWLRGKLDAPIVLATDKVLLADWKTGKKREEPFELELGALLLQARRPELTKLYGVYIWLKTGERGQPHDVSDTTKTWNTVQHRANEIATAMEHGRFEKTPGPLCGFCDVRDCQHNRKRK